MSRAGEDKDGMILELLGKLLALAEDTGRKVDKLHAVEVKMQAAVRRQAEQIEAERLKRLEEKRKEQREAEEVRREENDKAALKKAREDETDMRKWLGH
jgi:hypothetical protein